MAVLPIHNELTTSQRTLQLFAMYKRKKIIEAVPLGFFLRGFRVKYECGHTDVLFAKRLPSLGKCYKCKKEEEAKS